MTAQLTWLTADRLATVSVTAPSRDMARSMDQARSTAVLLDRALSR